MRGMIKFLFGLVIILAIVWLGLWWYAEGRMESGFTAWADQMATQGWKISYTSDKRGTSPAAATLTLTDLVLSSPPDAQGRAVSVTLPSLALRIQALSPLVLHTDFPTKINVDAGAQVDAAVTFGSIWSTEQLDPSVIFAQKKYPFRVGDGGAANIDILASQGSLLVLHMDRFSGHAEIDPDAGAAATAFNLTEIFDGIAVSPLMTRMLSIPFDGKITHLALGLKISGPVPADWQSLAAQIRAADTDRAAQQKLLITSAHDWVAKGGNGSASLNIVVGPTTLAADGTLKFDSNVQPEGSADLTANHLDQLTAAITNAYPGVQDTVAQAEAQASPYLTTTDAGGQTLTMHVVYGSGAVNVNGQKVGDLPPIDWNTLENPPPPTPVAPDDGSDDNAAPQ